MTFKMVHPHKGDLLGIGKGFGRGQPDQKRPDQAGPAGHGDAVDLVEFYVRLLQGFEDHGNDRLHMFP